jgi:hypothetical protein
MFDNFLIGFLAGIFVLIKFICAVVMVLIAAMPVVAILVYGASGWWMLSYLLIVPTFCGICNMFYD